MTSLISMVCRGLRTSRTVFTNHFCKAERTTANQILRSQSTCLSKVSSPICSKPVSSSYGISHIYRQFSSFNAVSLNFLKASTPLVNQVQTYKVRVALKKRCQHCFFVKRHERWFVECKEKPRHKQMQLMSRRKLYRHEPHPRKY